MGTGTLLEEAVAVIERNWGVLLAAGGGEALVQFAQDFENRERIGGVAGIVLAAIAMLAVTWAIQAIAARGVFLREGIADPNVAPRYMAYFGVSVVTLLGVVVGSVFLVVPGILLMLHWALAANFTVARDMGVGEALRASSDATEGHRSAIFGAYLVLGVVSYGPYFFLAQLAGGTAALNSAGLLSVFGVIRVVWSVLSNVLGLAVGIGIFSAFAGRGSHLREVFA